MDAYKYAATHRDETIKVAHEMTNAKPDDKRADFITDQAVRDKQIDPTLAIQVDRIEWMQDLFVKAGVIPKAVPTASLIDTSVRDEAAKLAAEWSVTAPDENTAYYVAKLQELYEKFRPLIEQDGLSPVTEAEPAPAAPEQPRLYED